jgi:hypothetical protein
MRKLWIVLICLVLTLPIAQGNSLNHTRSNAQSPSRADLLDGGWLEERENVTILHVNGSN